MRYNPDGTLAFVGRNDGQIKIHGQRVELGEIEHAIQAAVPNGIKVAVDYLMLNGAAEREKQVVAFLTDQGSADDSEPGLQLGRIKELSASMSEKLLAVPRFIHPSLVLFLSNFPATPSGKTDRRRLRKIAEQLGSDELKALRPRSSEHRQPSTQAERRVQALFAKVLGLQATEIGADDSFPQIGGDSIGAMKLVAAARDEGLALTIADVFKSLHA